MDLSVQSLGIDVSKATLNYCLLGSGGEIKEEGVVANDATGIHELSSMCGDDTGSIHVVIESAGDYHLLATLMLNEAGYCVHLINPLLTHMYQRANVRKCKTDKADARLLGRMGVEHREDLSVFHLTTDQVVLKKKAALIHQLTKTKQRLASSLRQTKETLDILGDGSSAIETGDKAVKAIEDTIENLEKEVTDAGKQDPMVAKLAEIPGVSEKSAALLMSAFLGKRFDSKEKMTAFAGLDVSVRQSGTSIRGKGRLSKRGNPGLRKTLFGIAWGLKQHNEAFKRLYDYYRGKHKHYTAVMNILARKFLHVLFGMMKNQTPFNPAFIKLPA